MEVTLVPSKGSNLASRLFFLFVNYFITTFVLQLPPIAYLVLYPFFTLFFSPLFYLFLLFISNQLYATVILNSV
jgi:ABC-type multidrug transport system permease subunit